MNTVPALSEPRLNRPTMLWGALALAVALVALGAYVTTEPARVFAALLTAGLFGASLCLGAAILLATQGAAGATWHRPIVPMAHLLSRTLVVPVVALGLVFVLGLPALYPWARPDVVAESHLLHEKAGWLNVPFFLARAIVVVLVWFGALAFMRTSRNTVKSSILFLVVLAPTLSIASWDWIMSLEPEWFSTMYGVYLFSGSFLGGIAAVILLGLSLEGTEILPTLDGKRRHDLGKLLFAFSAFWAYIWFCEAMLIWYSNLPEEVTHFTLRLSAGWTLLFWLNPILNFLVPFVALMSVEAKRHRNTLWNVALIVLVGRWLDTFLLVRPSIGPFSGIPILSLVTTGALLAGMALVFERFAAKRKPASPHP